MLLQRMWVHWESEDASADFPFPLPVGVPCCGNFHGWSASPVNFLPGIWCMQEGESAAIAVPVAVFVLLYLGYAVFLEKLQASCLRGFQERREKQCSL